MPAPTCVTAHGRYTSKDLFVEYQPCGATQAHVQHLYFDSTVTAGTFRLRINGYRTTAITFSAVAATLITSINSAIAALSNIGPTEIVATGSAVTDLTLTSVPTQWYTIQVVDDLLTGNSTNNPNVKTLVTQQGSTWYTLSAEASKFSFEETSEFVDMTAISEYEKTEEPVSSAMTFSMSIFDTVVIWNSFAVRAGFSGTLRVFKKGKVVGNEYFEIKAVWDKGATDLPDHEKVTVELSGKRQGAMLVEFGSIWEG